MDIPFDDILTIVRSADDLKAGFDALRDIGRALMRSAVWDKIRTPEVQADVWLAGAWLKESISTSAETIAFNDAGGQAALRFNPI